MPTTYDKDVVSHLVLGQVAVAETELVLNCYGSINQARAYFDNRVRNENWLNSTVLEQKKALVEATRIIDSLNYRGSKFSSTQLHQFPRSPNSEIPKDIEFATYEIANKILDGWDPDFELEKVTKTGEKYAQVSTSYDSSFALDHVRAGIPSITAWSHLKPYLRDIATFHVSRVN